jgi:uncharacterized protein YebE (UPF0316 family)
MAWLVAATLPEFLVLPLLVFTAELCVVTVGTVRIIFVSRGRKSLSAVLGFFEVSIWLFAIGQIMRNLTDPGCYLGFAAGFALGNFLGVVIEKRLAMGSLAVHTITRRDAAELVERLRRAEYGVTSVEGRGATGPVQLVVTVIRRRDLPAVLAIIRQFDPRAFYSVHELRAVAAGVFPTTGCPAGLLPALPMRLVRREEPAASLP